VGVNVKNAVGDYVVMLVYSSCVGFLAPNSGHPSEGCTRGTERGLMDFKRTLSWNFIRALRDFVEKIFLLHR
jgi:hypothetical protein